MFAPRISQVFGLAPGDLVLPWATQWPGRMGRTTSDLLLSYLRPAVDAGRSAPRLWGACRDARGSWAGEGELAAVLGLIADAADDQPGVALIHGEAGGGKTRLLDEVVSRLPPRTVVCRGAGVGFLGGRIPYAPLVAALRSLLARLPRADVPRVLGADPGDIGLLLPELGVRREGPSGPGPADRRGLVPAGPRRGDPAHRAGARRPALRRRRDPGGAGLPQRGAGPPAPGARRGFPAGRGRRGARRVAAGRPPGLARGRGRLWPRCPWPRPARSSPTCSGATPGRCSASR